MRIYKSIDKDIIQKQMDKWDIPGLAYGIIADGQPDEIQCLGWRDKENSLSVNEDTQFCIASCSKAMNAAMIVALADEGILDLDEPVTTYAPELQMWDPETNANMSLRDMLCHRTGLAGYDIMWPDPLGRRNMAERMRYLKPNKPFREKSQYSNLIYALSGYVAERAAGKSWPELMKKYIFDPLKMTRTTCTAAEIEMDDNHAFGYQVLQDGRLAKLPFWDMDMAGPAATVNSTIKDMLKWIHFHISGGKTPDGRQLISPELFRQIHEPQITYDDTGRPDADCYACTGYGLGWRTGTYCGHPFQKHTGKIEGYSSIQSYLPGKGAGIVILMNLHTPANPIFYPMVYSFYDEYMGIEDHDWWKRFGCDGKAKPPLSAYTDCFHDLTKTVFSEQDKDVPFDGNAADWVGSYFDPGYGNMSFREDDNGNLRLCFRDQELEVLHWGKNQFLMNGVKSDTETFTVPVELIKNDGSHQIRIWYEPLYERVCFLKTEK